MKRFLGWVMGWMLIVPMLHADTVVVIQAPRPVHRPLMQVALLLDTSNSMDGLIVQAKQQLWKIANQLSSAERRGYSPIVQIALYEYGNNGLSAEGNYIRQVLPFTSDMDLVSEKLFSLRTNGGQEYCGAVVQRAVFDLAWSADADVYKAIFIAGNEPFTQGPVGFRTAMNDARRRGIVVNTIFCGNREEGIASGWSQGAQLARGDFWSIDSDARVVVAPTPYDAEIERLGASMNDTYLAFESQLTFKTRQVEQDHLAAAGKEAGASVERSIFKASSQYAAAPKWDAVNALAEAPAALVEQKREDLPMEVRGKSVPEIQAHLKDQAAKRKGIQDQIQKLTAQRQKFLANQAKNQGPMSLDQAMGQALKVQTQRVGFKMK